MGTGEDIKTWNFAKLNSQGKGSTKEMDTLAVAIQTKTTAKETKTAKEKTPETKQTAKNNAKSSPVTKEEIDTIRKQIRVKIKDNRAALKNIFAKLDKDKSDSLSKKEFGKLILAVMKKAPSKAVLKEIWKDASRSTTLTVLE